MLDGRQMKVYEKQAEIAKAVGHPFRLAILDFLKDGEQCVCDIAERIGAERSNVSRHLSVMVNAGVLEYRKDGLKVIYRLRTPCVLDFFKCMTACLKAQLEQESKLLSSL